jgi:hypothetical protein
MPRKAARKKIDRQKANRIFLLSPAYAGGDRARMIMSERAQFDLARRMRAEGATIAEVFTFLSGLYFRGKIAYASAFARTVDGLGGALVITPTRGLVDARSTITLDDLREFAEVDVDLADVRYRKPLERDARKLAKKLSSKCEVILLGSIASKKYVEVLLAYLGERLRFPADFVGRGDMSRGALMLRAARAAVELAYEPVETAVRRGRRAPRIAKM